MYRFGGEPAAIAEALNVTVAAIDHFLEDVTATEEARHRTARRLSPSSASAGPVLPEDERHPSRRAEEGLEAPHSDSAWAASSSPKGGAALGLATFASS